jgi:methylated-DNA-[protein]-cysteine S-methyltransferase
MVQIITYNSPVGALLIGAHQNKLVLCDWTERKNRTAIDARIQKHLQCEFIEEETNYHTTTTKQLDAYFSGKLTQFELDLNLCGTAFQQQVWQALMQIPYGATSTYLQQSKILQNPLAIRAVAAANGANAISIIVPCHRIIGSNGDLIGYAGGLQAKHFLLELEQSTKPQQQLSLF